MEGRAPDAPSKTSRIFFWEMKCSCPFILFMIRPSLVFVKYLRDEQSRQSPKRASGRGPVALTIRSDGCAGRRSSLEARC